MYGTSFYALRHQATHMFAYLGNGDGQAVVVRDFAPLDMNYMLRFDVLSVPGCVAINRWDGGCVFDVTGSGGAGTNVILYGWNGNNSPNQIWQMVPIEVYAQPDYNVSTFA